MMRTDFPSLLRRFLQIYSPYNVFYPSIRVICLAMLSLAKGDLGSAKALITSISAEDLKSMLAWPFGIYLITVGGSMFVQSIRWRSCFWDCLRQKCLEGMSMFDVYNRLPCNVSKTFVDPCLQICQGYLGSFLNWTYSKMGFLI